MSTLQERLRALADPQYGLARGFDDAQATINEAADALDAAAIDLSEAKRAWRYERDRADAAVAKLNAIDAIVTADGPIGYIAALRWLDQIYDVLHPKEGTNE